MRIRGSGSNFFGFGGGGNRSDSFKHGRKPGQKVRGTILKWVSEDMAWVEIDGHRLLAQLKSKPPVGAQLTFLIKQLSPEIILKEIFEATTVGASALTLARDFETARTLFENQFRNALAKFGPSQTLSPRSIFIALLHRKQKLFTTFLDTLNCLQTINRSIAPQKGITLYYSPWLIPAARRHLGLTRKKDGHDGLVESITEFEINEFGMFRAEFLFKHPNTGYRLKLQRPSRGMELKRYLQSRDRAAFAGSIECLGVTSLPKNTHGGILAEIIFSQ